MRRRNLAWILLPAAIVIMVVVTFVVSNYQKEMGLAQVGKGGRASVAAAAQAQSAASGTGAPAYDTFSHSLMAALAAANSMPVNNPAERRLRIALSNTLDCLAASREAWQAEVEQTWDPSVAGSESYWLTLHPSLLPRKQDGALSAAQVRDWSNAGAADWLKKALDLVE
jgi:hypothetical protein